MIREHYRRRAECVLRYLTASGIDDPAAADSDQTTSGKMIYKHEYDRYNHD